MTTATLANPLALFRQLERGVRHHFSPVQRAARAFRGKRADYYEYLHDLLEDMSGQKNMVDIFKEDARRYQGEPRGVLSQYWADRHEGADLLHTWGDTMPRSDLMLLGAAVLAGGPDSIKEALAEVARLVRMRREMMVEFLTTIFVGVIALGLTAFAVVGMPLGYVPLLRVNYHFVPVELWGPSGQRLLAYSAHMKQFLGFYVAAGVGALSWLFWSFANWTGPLRDRLDQRFIAYRLYREARSVEFLTTLSSVLAQRGSASLNTREGLVLIREHAQPWLRAHCDRMLARLNMPGESGVEIYDTGLLSRENFNYLSDMFTAKGADGGLKVAAVRIEQNLQKSMKRTGKVLQVTLLLIGLGTVFAMAAWAGVVLGELKQATAAVFTR